MITLAQLYDYVARRLSRGLDAYYDDGLWNYHAGSRAFSQGVYPKITYGSCYAKGFMDKVFKEDAMIFLLLNTNLNAKKE